MPVTDRLSDRRIRRCAVCKIDLKGRFVFVDDAVEELFGFSMEDLFARPFSEFLVESDQEVIERILDHRSRYESHFETTTVRIVTASGATVPVSITASLNFAGGSPVNFQILLDPCQETSPAVEAATNAEPGGLAIEALIALQRCEQLADLVGRMRDVVGDGNLVVYRGNDAGLELVASTYGEAETVPPIGSLHNRIAETGAVYSPADQEAVQQAVQKDRNAPNEYVAGISDADGDLSLIHI